MGYRLLPMAEADIESIADHIAADNPAAALRLVESFIARWELLATQPRSGAQRDDLAAGVRHVVIGNYLAFYRLAGDGVEIVRVIHGRRAIRPEDIGP